MRQPRRLRPCCNMVAVSLAIRARIDGDGPPKLTVDL